MLTELTNEQKQDLCRRCQLCCREMHFQIRIPPNRMAAIMTQEFYHARGCKLRFLKTGTFVIVPVPCPHLTPTGCDCYNIRPEACKLYEGPADPLMSDRCLWLNHPETLEKTP